MIKAIIISIVYVALFIWMKSYKSKQNNTVSEGAKSFSVTMPDALMIVYTAMFLFGVLLLIVFSITYQKGQAGTTKGHIIFAMVFASIGLLVMFICVRWRIHVEEEQFTVHYAFKPQKTYAFKGVNKVVVGKKGEMAIYVDDKKVVTIDSLATNAAIIKKRFKSERNTVFYNE